MTWARICVHVANGASLGAEVCCCDANLSVMSGFQSFRVRRGGVGAGVALFGSGGDGWSRAPSPFWR
jgi:hypothetical protein